MPEEENKKEIENSSNNTPEVNPIMRQKLEMLMATGMDNQNLPINEEHVAEMLSQRRQINEFINNDKTRESSDKRYFLTIMLAFILLISLLIILTYPEYFTQVLSLLIGGIGGFGFGKSFGK